MARLINTVYMVICKLFTFMSSHVIFPDSDKPPLYFMSFSCFDEYVLVWELILNF